MSPHDLHDRISRLAVWRRGDQRAPHKPLLLLYALARFAEGRLDLPFSEVEPALRALLAAFGPPRPVYRPEYPFWRLQADGLWTLDRADGLVQRQSNHDPTLSSLRATDPVGRFPDDVAVALRADPTLVAQLAQALLDAHFPTSVHDEILDAVGLELEAAAPGSLSRPRRRRDPAFREAVLLAYGYCCAVCGFEARVGGALVGLDAAHIMWHQAGGPDEVPNGLALCALHHRLLDRGAFTLAVAGLRETVVDVAESAHGGEGFERWLLAFHGQPIARPVSSSYCVAEPSVGWHRREVFRGPARERPPDR